MRQIVLDTETTGIGPDQGHRVIEIGCVELIDRRLTGNHYHVYLNPERKVDEGAFKVHGISDDFLKNKPFFEEVVDDFIGYIDGAELVIHNAPFDVGFLNAELKHVKWKKPLEHHCTILDTLVYARQKHPGQRNSLDALCKRYDIDNSSRQLHGALLDAEILALVYLAMSGGQASLFSEELFQDKQKNAQKAESEQVFSGIQLPILKATAQDLEAHEQLIKMLVEKSAVNYWSED